MPIGYDTQPDILGALAQNPTVRLLLQLAQRARQVAPGAPEMLPAPQATAAQGISASRGGSSTLAQAAGALEPPSPDQQAKRVLAALPPGALEQDNNAILGQLAAGQYPNSVPGFWKRIGMGLTDPGRLRSILEIQQMNTPGTQANLTIRGLLEDRQRAAAGAEAAREVEQQKEEAAREVEQQKAEAAAGWMDRWQRALAGLPTMNVEWPEPGVPAAQDLGRLIGGDEFLGRVELGPAESPFDVATTGGAAGVWEPSQVGAMTEGLRRKGDEQRASAEGERKAALFPLEVQRTVGELRKQDFDYGEAQRKAQRDALKHDLDMQKARLELQTGLLDATRWAEDKAVADPAGREFALPYYEMLQRRVLGQPARNPVDAKQAEEWRRKGILSDDQITAAYQLASDIAGTNKANMNQLVEVSRILAAKPPDDLSKSLTALQSKIAGDVGVSTDEMADLTELEKATGVPLPLLLMHRPDVLRAEQLVKDAQAAGNALDLGKVIWLALTNADRLAELEKAGVQTSAIGTWQDFPGPMLPKGVVPRAGTPGEQRVYGGFYGRR